MTEKELASLAARVKNFRDAAGWTQEELATRAGLSVAMVSQIEQGKRPDPRVSTVTKLADALAVDVGELIGRPPAGRKPGK
jgi:transcriptional regulator with XRE-family HTH domain